MSGRVVHFEVPFDDGDRARSFYKEAFGWQLMEMPDMGYTIVMTGPSNDSGPTESGFINGGMLSREQGATSGPVVVLDVESIDAALEKIGGLGGSTVVGKTPVGDMGFAAYFKDSEGNVMGLWETASSS
jgi:predicted enzyme related to lactoylglutathione lyase